jgi:uncharacterized protein (UPF0305 family)
MKNSNVVPFVDINAGIECALNTLGCRSTLSDICFVRSLIPIQTIIGYINTKPKLLNDGSSKEVYVERLSIMVIEEIRKIHTDIILPYHFYEHQLIDSETLELICSKLKKYNLRANTKIVQQLTWKSMQLLYCSEDIETLEHATNIVIKIYKKGDWYFPEGCPIEFENKMVLEDL